MSPTQELVLVEFVGGMNSIGKDDVVEGPYAWLTYSSELQWCQYNFLHLISTFN